MNVLVNVGPDTSDPALLLEDGSTLLLEDGGMLSLDGTFTVPLKTNTLAIEDVVDERSVARFTLVDVDRELSFSKGDPVTITSGTSAGVSDVTVDSANITVDSSDVTLDGAGEFGGTEVVFAGYIEEVELDEPAGAARFHNIVAVDHHYLADKRLVARSYIDRSVTNIVDDLIDRYLSDEGVIAGSIAFDSTPTILPAFVFDYIPVSQALTELADYGGYWWYINPLKALQFRRRDSFAAPWTLTDADVLRRQRPPKLRRAAPDYRNTQVIRNVVSKTDTLVETAAGDSRTRTFTVEYDVAEVPSIRVNGSLKTVGIRGIDDVGVFPSVNLFPSTSLLPSTFAQWYWKKGDNTLSQHSSEPQLGSADILEVTYVGLFDTVVVSSDDDGVRDRQTVEGGTGKVEQALRNRRVEGRDAAFALAAAKLDKFGVIGQTFQFTTRKAGLKPGMLLPVDMDLFDLSADLLVTSVDIRDQDATELRYTVTAVEGPQDESWSKFFARLYDVPDTQAWSENRQVDTVVTRLFEFEKTWDGTEEPDPFGELFPSDDLVPAATTFPMFDPDDRFTHVEVEGPDGVLGRKVLTQRQGLSTGQIVTTQYLSPNDAVGTTTDVVWYGGYRATSEVGSGVEVARETLDDVKTVAEAWSLVRTDVKAF